MPCRVCYTPLVAVHDAEAYRLFVYPAIYVRRMPVNVAPPIRILHSLDLDDVRREIASTLTERARLTHREVDNAN